MKQRRSVAAEREILMLKPEQISLNAVRVFLIVAETGSLKRAAARLGVTAGAVSHQVRGLEEALGVHLFQRAHNSIHLTEAGARLAEQARPGLQCFETALQTAASGVAELSVQVSLTLATRWLIPRLETFKANNPDLRIRIETIAGNGMPPGPEADLAIVYHPLGTIPVGASVLFEDRCRPYLAPTLAEKITDPDDLERIPVLQSTRANWDWQIWLEAIGRPAARLSYAGHFDLDDAALRAAVAGLGIVLAPAFIIEDDLEAGRLLPLPGAPETLMGAYTLHRNGPASRRSDRFVQWLGEAAGSL